ncbi:uroporphyrinogen-III synthase-like [Ptychodera flava]|uniref:uroporphyrinogen-III synthase-like n=1 Tax=Ptychodera flava TaxID=63121 RepID=UPI00396A33A7
MKRETLPKILEAKNISLKCLEVYRTIPDPDLQKALQDYKSKVGTPDACVFFSPSGVKFSKMALAKIYPSMQETVQWVAIGPTTSNAMEKDGFRVSVTASKPTPQALLTSILEWKQRHISDSGDGRG